MSRTTSSFETSPRFGRRLNTSPISSNENPRFNGMNPSLNECSERDSRRNDIRESFMYLNILDEVIELADRTNNLKLKVIGAFRDRNCEECNFSEHGICRAHRYGSGVYNTRLNGHWSRIVGPSPVENVNENEPINNRREEARGFTETMNNLDV